MSTKQNQGASPKVTTPLQYLALTNRQLLIFYGSVITVGSATQKPFLVVLALLLAGLPQVSMLLLSVLDREALKALGEDASKPTEVPATSSDAIELSATGPQISERPSTSMTSDRESA